MGVIRLSLIEGVLYPATISYYVGSVFVVPPGSSKFFTRLTGFRGAAPLEGWPIFVPSRTSISALDMSFELSLPGLSDSTTA